MQQTGAYIELRSMNSSFRRRLQPGKSTLRLAFFRSFQHGIKQITQRTLKCHFTGLCLRRFTSFSCSGCLLRGRRASCASAILPLEFSSWQMHVQRTCPLPHRGVSGHTFIASSTTITLSTTLVVLYSGGMNGPTECLRYIRRGSSYMITWQRL